MLCFSMSIAEYLFLFFSNIDNAPLDITKSPSYSMSLTKQSLNESKAHDTTASLKKVSLADGTSVYDG